MNRRKAKTPRRLVLDTETTGLRAGEDEILTLSIIDEAGNVLWDRAYRPEHVAEWPGAQAVNGIAPADVAGCPPIAGDAAEISALLATADVLIGYNIGFDAGFLKASGVAWPDVECIDVMREFAPVYGEWADWCGDYKWQKLVTAAAYVGYDWGADKAHGSAADCRATLAVLRWLEEREAQQAEAAKPRGLVARLRAMLRGVRA